MLWLRAPPTNIGTDYALAARRSRWLPWAVVWARQAAHRISELDQAGGGTRVRQQLQALGSATVGRLLSMGSFLCVGLFFSWGCSLTTEVAFATGARQVHRLSVVDGSFQIRALRGRWRHQRAAGGDSEGLGDRRIVRRGC